MHCVVHYVMHCVVHYAMQVDGRGGSSAPAGPWQQLKPGVDISWREVADAIMRVYSTRTSGSFVMRKGASIVWNHQHADPEFGTMQAPTYYGHTYYGYTYGGYTYYGVRNHAGTRPSHRLSVYAPK